MTNEQRKQKRAAIPSLAVSDGTLMISGHAGDAMLSVFRGDQSASSGEYFNLESVPLSEQRELIRYLIGVYNWQVREANDGVAAGLPALDRVAEVKPPEGLDGK